MRIIVTTDLVLTEIALAALRSVVWCIMHLVYINVTQFQYVTNSVHNRSNQINSSSGTANCTFNGKKYTQTILRILCFFFEQFPYNFINFVVRCNASYLTQTWLQQWFAVYLTEIMCHPIMTRSAHLKPIIFN